MSPTVKEDQFVLDGGAAVHKPSDSRITLTSFREGSNTQGFKVYEVEAKGRQWLRRQLQPLR